MLIVGKISVSTEGKWQKVGTFPQWLRNKKAAKTLRAKEQLLSNLELAIMHVL